MVTARRKGREDRVGTLTHLNVELNLGVYATGGVAFDPTLHAEGKTVVNAIISPQEDYAYSFDYDTNKITAWDLDTANQVTNATDLSARNVRALFILGP